MNLGSFVTIEIFGRVLVALGIFGMVGLVVGSLRREER